MNILKRLLALGVTAAVAVGTLCIGSFAGEKLAAPTLTLTAKTGTTVTMTWTAVKGADKYAVYVKQPGSDTYKKTATTAKLTYTAAKLAAGKTYFRVYALDKDGNRGTASASKYTTLTGVASAAAKVPANVDYTKFNGTYVVYAVENISGIKGKIAAKDFISEVAIYSIAENYGKTVAETRTYIKTAEGKKLYDYMMTVLTPIGEVVLEQAIPCTFDKSGNMTTNAVNPLTGKTEKSTYTGKRSGDNLILTYADGSTYKLDLATGLFYADTGEGVVIFKKK
ncbi:MAG: hypothetical protein LBN40_02835 [Oscillospiraceae bacterium]|jgi:hypothetical protein|nr:hypothetical protein [Oscillospiraceae bacterium]